MYKNNYQFHLFWIYFEGRSERIYWEDLFSLVPQTQNANSGFIRRVDLREFDLPQAHLDISTSGK